MFCGGVERQQDEDMRFVVVMFAKTWMLQSETRQQSRARTDSALCKRDSTTIRTKRIPGTHSYTVRIRQRRPFKSPKSRTVGSQMPAKAR